MKACRKLEVSIRWHSKKCYRIFIDGDVFWADSYNHALAVLFEILSRDELEHGKVICNNV